MLTNLEVILMRPRFPENIGMVARACANMGCYGLSLVQPERYCFEKAAPLATSQGLPLLENMTIFPDLNSALANFQAVYGSTARLGGWRKHVFTPWQAARKIRDELNQGFRIALLFGSEDCGLSNQEICHCQGLVHITTNDSATSLNLAQACLLLLYECHKALRSSCDNRAYTAPNTITLGQLALIEDKLRMLLEELGCNNGKNPDLAFMTWHQMLCRLQLRQHEFDAIMGLLRQFENMTKNI